jgi:SAM-dependent methyltransferase
MAIRKNWLLNRILFLSQRRTCNICLHSFHAFLPLPEEYPRNWEKYGFPYRSADFETLNAAEYFCPKCGANDRDRFYAYYLDQTLFSKGLSRDFLDFAPSHQLANWLKARNKGRYVSADLFMDNVDVKCDIQNMACFPDASFQFVICSHVLEHVEDDLKAIREIHRVLSADGQAILMVPLVKQLDRILEDPAETDITIRWHKFGQDDHIRLYGAEPFAARLASAGFKLMRYRAAERKDDMEKIAVTNSSVIYIVTK